VNILLPGAAGFIGAKVAEKLLEKGHYVIGIDNLNDYYDVRLKEWRLEHLKKFKNFRFFKIDIENFKELEKIFKEYEFDIVINEAARAGVRYSIENPHVYFSTNVKGTLNLLELCKKYNVKKFILASTSSLYAGCPLPFKEDLPVNSPISPYAASKKAAEMLAYTYHYLYDINVIILRYFTVYGEAGRPDMSVFKFIKKVMEGKEIEVYGDGTQSRDFTHVDDISEGTIRSLTLSDFHIINLGGDNPHKLNYLIELIEKFTGKKMRIVYKNFHKADIRHTWADITKAKKMLKWEPKISLEEGIERTVKWFKDNWDWVKDLRV